ncbi:LysR family transcriptional regulator [uncultured Pseudacidovorax sp.]|uniref:LysR family transcriptional regulator n=1 Tax=uncultured Pseudacidovorax sp. TaxID=679313 RepID=UPI0025DD3641|nr:LysR family transcriptional regulator [uncultured Pseudacidovorax sp.]
MASYDFNYRHLHYFWTVAREGGFSRAAARLGVAVQTVSAQVRELEKSLGHQLLKPEGRSVALTEAGMAALQRAEEIFQLGQELPELVRQAATEPAVRLAVGLSDGISKLAAHAMVEPVLQTPALRLVCHEGELEQLLGELAMHHLDMVLAGQPAPSRPALRLASHRIAEAPVDWWGPAALVRAAAMREFPQSLADLPVLLPTSHSALRPQLDRWFERHGLRPRVAGEFEDSALLAVFAARGLGVFPVSRLGAGDLGLMRGLRLLGRSDDLQEEIHLIRSRRGQNHPLVQQIEAHARQRG